MPESLPSRPLYTRPRLKESASGYKGDRLIWLVLVGKYPCEDSYVGASSGLDLAQLKILAGLLSLCVPGTLLRRSRGVTPSSVAPEFLGDTKSRVGTRLIIIFCLIACGVARVQSSQGLEEFLAVCSSELVRLKG